MASPLPLAQSPSHSLCHVFVTWKQPVLKNQIESISSRLRSSSRCCFPFQGVVLRVMELRDALKCMDGKATDKLEGANPSVLANKVAKIAGSTANAESAAPASLGMAAGPTVLETVKEMAKKNNLLETETLGANRTDNLTKWLRDLVGSHPVMLFMKATPEEPKCGFSSKVVELLKREKVEFQSFDVLSDDEVRQGLKTFSNWPSYPQLYVKGELIGGSDIVLEMHKSGEFKKVLAEKSIGEETLEDRLKNLILSSPVMLFMKGNPDAPRCGFSSKVVGALRDGGISFGSFDILSDEEVRQGLKAYSNWPTFPQLYYKGELIGGCDIVLELSTTGELKSTLSE
ncbi:Monothiol glutaredoxin-S17 [Platanthera guangdongensis]|uniref:Monothiol glutaredoxin-S17 n=1 Tax=Platanthera guangdongensis TaxID=2320717 RepID=A0ABR2M1Z4_9ASPA